MKLKNTQRESYTVVTNVDDTVNIFACADEFVTIITTMIYYAVCSWL